MEKKCIICAKHFEAVRASRKFCSDACKYKGFLKTHGFGKEQTLIVNNVMNDKQNLNEKNKLLYSGMSFTIDRELEKLRYPESGILINQWHKQGNKTVEWTNQRLIALLNHLLSLSYQKKVNYQQFLKATDACTSLCEGERSANLPANYPFWGFMDNLKHRLHKMLFIIKEKGSHPIRIPYTYKARMFAVMGILEAYTFPFRFNELDY